MDTKLCRICCENSGNVNIYVTEENEIQLSAKLMYCCGSLDIKETDGLPSHICQSCQEDLLATYKFVLKCEASDKKLRSMLINGIVVKEDPCIESTAEVKTEISEDGDHVGYADHFLDLHEEIKSEGDTETPRKIPKIPCKKRTHRKRVKLKKETKCSVCGKECSCYSALATHMRIHTNERPYHCTLCDKKYKDSGTLKRHFDRNHMESRERKFVCENCGKQFYTKGDITIHMRVHTGETPYACSECPLRFTQISTLTKHKMRHSGQKTQICTTCGKVFWTKDELKKHYSVHNNVRNYSCSVCNVQFKQKSSIKKHMRKHLEPNGFVCNYCGQTFNLKGNLKIHIERKHSEKSGFCSVCSKSVSNMEVHMWRHTGQRPLKCEFCTSSFYEMKALALHINFKHKKTDRFKCSVEGCSMSFPSKPMMVFHVAKYHKMQTLYSCDRCPRGFYRKNDLSRHMIGTHKERLSL